MYLHVFSKQAVKLKHLHSFVRENFDASRPSLDIAETFYVVSETPAKAELPMKTFALQSEFEAGETVRIFCRAAFASRGRDNYVKPINNQEAMVKFTLATGLTPKGREEDGLGAFARFMGRVAEKKFDIMNAFEITGTFTVENPDTLASAVKVGIGARRSYGFGLVLVNRQS